MNRIALIDINAISFVRLKVKGIFCQILSGSNLRLSLKSPGAPRHRLATMMRPDDRPGGEGLFRIYGNTSAAAEAGQPEF
jgi:hypothetical protein